MTRPMVQAFGYQVFGLRISSELELPELFPAERADPDVTIRWGSVPAGAAEEHVEADGDALVLNIAEVARFRIEGGCSILIDPEPNASERNVRLFLLGSAFGALLHQRGMLPLHANAVEIDGRAVAFLGESGAGKSTLAAWFHDQGYNVLGDDVCLVGAGADGTTHVYPGLPRLRLWNEALVWSGRDTSRYQRSYVSAERVDKFDVPINCGAADRPSSQLAAIYLLQRGDQFSTAEVEGVAAAEALFSHTYRGAYLDLLGGQKSHWEAVVTLVRTIPLYHLIRPWDLTKVDEQARLLVDHVQRIVALERDEAPTED